MHIPHIYMHTCSRVPHTPIHIYSHVKTRYTQIHRAYTCKRFPLDHHPLRCLCPQRGCSCNKTHTTLPCEVALKRFPLQEAEMSPEFLPKKTFFLLRIFSTGCMSPLFAETLVGCCLEATALTYFLGFNCGSEL